jgi:hypothetical protein
VTEILQIFSEFILPHSLQNIFLFTGVIARYILKSTGKILLGSTITLNLMGRIIQCDDDVPSVQNEWTKLHFRHSLPKKIKGKHNW